MSRGFLSGGPLVVATLLLLGCTVQMRAQEAESNALEGLWRVSFTPDDASKSSGANVFTERLLFEETNFTAETFSMLYGFAPTAYQVGGQNGTSFSVTLTSENRGTLVFAGQRGVSGVTGTLVWTKPDGTVHRYTFSGSADQSEG